MPGGVTACSGRRRDIGELEQRDGLTGTGPVSGIFHLEAESTAGSDFIRKLARAGFSIGSTHQHRNTGLFAFSESLGRDMGDKTTIHDRFHRQVKLSKKRGPRDSNPRFEKKNRAARKIRRGPVRGRKNTARNLEGLQAIRFALRRASKANTTVARPHRT